MASVKVRYLVRKNTAKRGAKPRYLYYWQPAERLKKEGWETVRLGSNLAAAVDQAEHLNEQLDNWRNADQISPDTQSADSISNLVDQYLESPAFRRLADSTRKNYRQILNELTNWCGDFPAAAMTPAILEQHHFAMFQQTPAHADNLVRHFRIVWRWANRQRLINLPDPSSAIRKSHRAEKGVPWTKAQLEHICETAIAMNLASVALAIRCQVWHAQRRGDILSMTRTDLKNGYLTQSKTKRVITLEWDPELLKDVHAEIKKNPNHTHIFISEQTGRQWQPVAFGKNFERIRATATKGDPTLGVHPMPSCAKLVCKDLRHTGVLELAKSGATTLQIANITGHSVKQAEAIVDRYLVRSSEITTATQRRRLSYRSED